MPITAIRIDGSRIFVSRARRGGEGAPCTYRSPAGEVPANLFKLLQRFDFLYDSSLMDDVNRYRHTLPDGSRSPDRAALALEFGRAPYALFSIKNPRPIFTNERMLSTFKAGFEEIYGWGELYGISFTHK